jgi:hypothetical protein
MTMPRPSARKRILWRTLSVVLGIFLGLGVGEIAARIAGVRFRPHLRNRVYFAEPDPVLGWRNRAGLAGPYGGDEFLTHVTINPAGQRGPHHPVERTPGRVRLAILGDSQAWGDGVGDAEVFTTRLDGDGVEALNFATLGYGTDQELLTFERLAAAYRPDVLVVAVFVGNDFSDNLSRGTFQYPKPRFEIASDGSLRLEGVPVESPTWLHGLVEVHRFLMRRSALLNAIASATADMPEAQDLDPPQVRIWDSFYERDPSEQDRRGFAMTGRLLREIVARARAAGIEPVVLLLPESWQVAVAQRPHWREQLREQGADWRRPQRVIREAVADEDVLVIDALPALARAARGERPDATPTYYSGWRHLNARGHAVVADLLERRLGLRERRSARRSYLAQAPS